jgi:hypothetical protein
MIQALMRVDGVATGEGSNNICLHPVHPVEPGYLSDEKEIPNGELKLTIAGSEAIEQFKLGQLYLVNLIRLAEQKKRPLA